MQSDEKYSQYWKSNIKSDESGKFTDPDLESGYQTYATARDQINEAKSPNKLKALNETIYQDYNPQAIPDYKPPEPDDVAGDPVKTQGKSIDPRLSSGGIEQNDQMASLMWMKRLLSTDDLSTKAKSGRTTPYWKAVLDRYGERYDNELHMFDDPKKLWTEDRVKAVDALDINPWYVAWRSDEGRPMYDTQGEKELAELLGARPSLLRKIAMNMYDADPRYLHNLYEGWKSTPYSPFKAWSVDKNGVPLDVKAYNTLAGLGAEGESPLLTRVYSALKKEYPDMPYAQISRMNRWIRDSYKSRPEGMAPYEIPAPEATSEKGDKPSQEEKPKGAPKEKPKRIENRGVRAARKLAQKYGVIKADERRIPTWEEIRKMAEDPSESYEDATEESDADGKVLYPDKDNEIGESQ